MAAEQRLTKDQWLVLVAAFLGWMFDGVEMGLFPLIAPPALRDLLQTTDQGIIGGWNGVFAALFLLGAAAGGLLFGWLGDKLGRVRSMAISIAAYSVFTAACYFAQSPVQLATLRFIASMAMGGEWALGVALVMECWPGKYRPILAGAIGAANNMGIALIAVVGMFIHVTGDTWRLMMLTGLVPAVLAVFVIYFVPESEKWKSSVKDTRTKPLREVFSPPLLRHTIVGIILCTVMMLGTWAAATSFGPLWTEHLAKQVADTPEKVAAAPGAKAVFQVTLCVGAMIGCFIGPLLGSLMGRRISYFLCALAALVVSQVFFGFAPLWWAEAGGNTSLRQSLPAFLLGFDAYGAAFLVMAGVMGCMAVSFFGLVPLYLPELFPTRMRATGQGIVFNAGRIMAAFGAIFSGQLVGLFDKPPASGYPGACSTICLAYLVGMVAIWFAPETKGKPLPE